MAGKDLRKLSKTELLELLVEQGRENLALKAKLEQAEAELAQRRISIAESGSLAEAALKLSGVFEAAQHAIDLYRENAEQEIARRLEAAGAQEAENGSASVGEEAAQ